MGVVLSSNTLFWKYLGAVFTQLFSPLSLFKKKITYDIILSMFVAFHLKQGLNQLTGFLKTKQEHHATKAHAFAF